MKLWRVLALSAACAASAVSAAAAAPADAEARGYFDAIPVASNDRDESEDAAGLFAFLSQELQRSSALVQRYFFDDGDDVAPASSVQLIVLEDDDDSAAFAPELSREEQALACETALQVLREKESLQQERKQLSQRLRSPFKRAFQALSLHYLDEASCDDLGDARLVAGCERFVEMEDAVRAFMARGRSDAQVCALAVASSVGGDAAAVAGELSCKLCKRFVQMIVQALAQEVSQVQVVREIIGDICDSMAPDSMCHTFLNEYDQIVDWLKHGSSPDVVCAQVGMCVAPTPAPPTESLVDLAAIALPASSSSVVAADASGHACGYCAHITWVVIQLNRVAPNHVNFARKLIEWGCRLSPKDCKCDVLVSSFDKIVAWVKQGKSPREICEALELCPKAPGALPPAPQSLADAFAALAPLAGGDGKTCFYCDYATTLLQIALQEQPETVDSARFYADLVCNMLGPDSVCHKYVAQFDAVVDQLKRGLKPRAICAAMKYCAAAGAELDATVVTHAATPFARGDDKQCTYCDYGALVLKVIMEQEPAQVDELRQAADLVCGFLGPDHVCHQYVGKLDALIDGLKQGRAPHAICVAIQYCTKSAVPARAAPALAALDRARDLADGKQCLYCDYVATLLMVAQQEDAAQVDELRMGADLVCNMLGPDNVCHKYVDALDRVIDGLKRGEHPRAICAALKYCTARAGAQKALPTVEAAGTTTTIDLTAFDQRLVKSVRSALEASIDGCFVCTQLASVVEVALQEDPAQIDQIRQIGDLVCGFLPAESKCRPVMNELDTVIDSLKKGEKPKAICHDLKFCKSASATPALAPTATTATTAAAGGSSSCSYCNGVVTVLEVALSEKPDAVSEAREAAGIVCGLLPADDTCHEDLKLFDAAVAQLKSGKQPHEVCQSLKFCDARAAASSVALKDLAALDARLAPTTRCSVCQQNSLLLASLVASPARLQTFDDEMKSICRLIPDTKECELLLKHRDTIVEALEQGDDIEAICERIGECGASSEPVEAKQAEAAFSVSCLLCEYTAEVVSHASKNENELRMAKVALETMCTILPPSARCDELSSKFDELVTLAQSGKRPGEACRAIALCGAADAKAAAAGGESVARSDYLLPAEFAPIGSVQEVE